MIEKFKKLKNWQKVLIVFVFLGFIGMFVDSEEKASLSTKKDSVEETIKMEECSTDEECIREIVINTISEKTNIKKYPNKINDVIISKELEELKIEFNFVADDNFTNNMIKNGIFMNTQTLMIKLTEKYDNIGEINFTLQLPLADK
jgi:hypothetical protein